MNYLSRQHTVENNSQIKMMPSSVGIICKYDGMSKPLNLLQQKSLIRELYQSSIMQLRTWTALIISSVFSLASTFGSRNIKPNLGLSNSFCCLKYGHNVYTTSLCWTRYRQRMTWSYGQLQIQKHCSAVF